VWPQSVAVLRVWLSAVQQLLEVLDLRHVANHCSGRPIMCKLAASRDQEQERVSSVAAKRGQLPCSAVQRLQVQDYVFVSS
jgi:hypothetical protein